MLGTSTVYNKNNGWKCMNSVINRSRMLETLDNSYTQHHITTQHCFYKLKEITSRMLGIYLSFQVFFAATG